MLLLVKGFNIGEELVSFRLETLVSAEYGNMAVGLC